MGTFFSLQDPPEMATLCSARLRSAQLERDIVEEVKMQMIGYLRGRRSLTNPWLRNSLTLADVFNDLPDIDDDRTVDRVMDECRHFPKCAWLVATRYNRLETLFSSNLPGDVPDLQDKFWIDGMMYLAQHDRWSCLEALLACGKDMVCWIYMGEKVASSIEDHETVVTVFDMMFARCVKLNCACLQEYVRFLARMNLDQFKIMAYSKNTTIRQIVLDNLEVLLSFRFLDRQFITPSFASGLNGCLIVACEAGLFTARTCTMHQPSLLDRLPHTPMGCAVRLNQPDVVCFMYHAGATSNRELFQLSRHPVLKAKTQARPAYIPLLPNINREYPTFDSVDAANNIQGFLTRVASTPRSLKSLCLLQVSRHLGCGHGRESRIEQLEIDNTLKKDLEFKDQKVLLKYPSQE